MLNTLWLLMLVGSIVCGALTSRLDAVAQASFDSARAAVTLALGLVGVMTFWLGLMRVLHEGGLLRAISRALRPAMVRLFPGVPADHPAMSMMILNLTANMLGLGNAATPFGLKAMMELERINKHKGSVSDAMALFLAVNTSGMAVFPTGIMAIRAALGSTSPGAIFFTTLISTATATSVAIVSCKLLAPLRAFRINEQEQPNLLNKPPADLNTDEMQLAAPPGALVVPPTPLDRLFSWGLVAVCAAAVAYALVHQATLAGGDWLGALKTAFSQWTVLLLLLGFVLFGRLRGVKVYDAVVEGGREGFGVALRIIPFMVAILVAVGMLRASGGIELLVRVLDPLTSLIGMPAEALPMALLRPLSGSGALAVAADIMKTQGPDSLTGQIVSTINGSTETTFYVIALYLGVVQVRNTRYLIIPCLLADVAGTLMAVWSCRLLLH
jgi:spore maturation protein SpmA